MMCHKEYDVKMCGDLGHTHYDAFATFDTGANLGPVVT